MKTEKPIKVIIVGAGCRGICYSNYAARFPERMKIVGVAEPRNHYRKVMAEKFNIPACHAAEDWRELSDLPRFADAVIIATPDREHLHPALAFSDKKYHILLEKPMAPTEDACREILMAAQRNDIILAVCHVMLYTRYTEKIKEIIQAGKIGDIVSMQHLESVGYWHQCHSFVRGNWRNSHESSPMLLAKSSHDIDWIRYIMARRCAKVASFGNLKHFKASEKPLNAGSRCLECGLEKQCPYSAVKIYLRDRVEKHKLDWPVDIITEIPEASAVIKALKEGPYGRCVYDCDNDVVDHQVVSMLFEDGATCSFTMTAFTPGGQGRKTSIFGTRGQLTGNGAKIEVFDFLTEKTFCYDMAEHSSDINDGHGGGDTGIMHAFISAIATGDASNLYSTPEVAFESHQMVFAAEKSRLSGKVVTINQ